MCCMVWVPVLFKSNGRDVRLCPYQGSSYAGRRRAGPPTTHDFRPAQKKQKKKNIYIFFFFCLFFLPFFFCLFLPFFFAFFAFFCQRHSPYGTRAQLFPWKMFGTCTLRPFWSHSHKSANIGTYSRSNFTWMRPALNWS